MLDYASSLEQLVEARLIDPVLGSGEKQGYRFRIVGADQFTFRVTAAPVEPGATGGRWFFLDESGVIRFSTDGPANEQSPPVGN